MTLVKVVGHDGEIAHYINPALVANVYRLSPGQDGPSQFTVICLSGGGGGFGTRVETREPVESVVARLEAATAPAPAPDVLA